MCTAKEGSELSEVMLKYYRGRQVEESDRTVLDDLCRASYMEYYSYNGRLYARPTDTGRSIRPKLIPRVRLLLGKA